MLRLLQDGADLWTAFSVVIAGIYAIYAFFHKPKY